MSHLDGQDPWGWRQQLACAVYVALVGALVFVLAIAGDPGR
ncbi:hypothetical protein [Streptomyces erythrochromogenes]